MIYLVELITPEGNKTQLKVIIPLEDSGTEIQNHRKVFLRAQSELPNHTILSTEKVSE